MYAIIFILHVLVLVLCLSRGQVHLEDATKTEEEMVPKLLIHKLEFPPIDKIYELQFYIDDSPIITLGVSCPDT